MAIVPTPQSFPIGLTTRPLTPLRWCGAYPPFFIEDGTVVGFDGPEDTLWKTYFPVGMPKEQMCFLYWGMKDFKITYPPAAMVSYTDVTSECGDPPHPVTQEIHIDYDMDGATVLSTADPISRNAFFPSDVTTEDLEGHIVPRFPGDLACATKRKLNVLSENTVRSTSESFNCDGKTSSEETLGTVLNFRLFDPYGTPAWMYSAETGLYYPRVVLTIHGGGITFACGAPTLLPVGADGYAVKVVEGTLTLKGKPGSVFFEEDIVIPAAVQGQGGETVSTLSTMDVTLEITSTWHD